MSKSGSSHGSATAQAHAVAQATDSSASPVDFGLTVSGTLKGQIRDIDVGLVTGSVSQTNTATEVATNTTVSTSDGTQVIGQVLGQDNAIVLQGDVSLDIAINGSLDGKIRDIDVGLITGDVTQTNTAALNATNLSVGGTGGVQAVGQTLTQSNYLDVSGHVDVSMTVNGSFKGQIRDIDVGLITGDITQANIAFQDAANLSVGGNGEKQLILQDATQSNAMVVVGNVDIDIVFDGNFKGQIRDVSIGLATGDFSQTNTSLQVGMNLAGDSKDVQAISQYIHQTSTLDASGNVHLTLEIDAGYKGDFRDIEIDLAIDNVIQTNTSVQIASTSIGDAVLI